MIDYKLVEKILDKLLTENHPTFADEDEKVCYLLQETWKLAQEEEREACAKVCEQSDDDGEGPDSWGWHSKDYATAIRARGQA
jgi:hypothetical protein